MGNVDLDVNIFSNAAEYTRNVLHAQGCCIVDLIEFRMTKSTPNQSQSHGSSSTSSMPALNNITMDSIPSSPRHSTNSSNHSTQQAVSISSNKYSASRSSTGADHRSYIPSASPIRILGHSGQWADHFDELSGEISMPILAKYLSMTRHSGLNSKTFIESKATPEFGLPALAPKAAKTLLCSSVAEADSQPAYLILALFEQEEVPFD